MKEEIEYLENLIDNLTYDIQRDLDYGYSGEKIDDQFERQRLLQNILNHLTK
jgi:hypothetical protein